MKRKKKFRDILGFSDFFYQTHGTLISKRFELIEWMDKNFFKDEKKSVFIKAYDYFILNPSEFDGATASKDIIIKNVGLDPFAMIHDYLYVKHKVYCKKSYLKRADEIYLNYIDLYTDTPNLYIKMQKTKLKIFIETIYYYLAKLRGIVVIDETQLLIDLEILEDYEQKI